MQAASPDRRADHVATLYHSDDFIVERVASFIAEGLAAGERVLVACTIAHWNTIAGRLDDAGVAYGRATSDGRLVFVDAEEIVDTISENGSVRADRFGQILQPLLSSPAKTRVYGEVVSLLAQRGNIEAAIAVERLGQELAHTRGIPILCGYHVAGPRSLSASEIALVREVHDRSSLESESLPPPSPAASASRGAGLFHAVRFYQDRESLARIVARFLGEGFLSGCPAVVIATREHREAISRVLSEQFFDLAGLERAGGLVMADADATLSSFMVDGMPDPGLFRDVVVPLLERASRGRKDCVVRAYGEMVDVLWQAGLSVAAVRLETLWNELAHTQAFALLCGYSMGHFYKDAAYQTICAQHTHLISEAGDSAALH